MKYAVLAAVLVLFSMSAKADMIMKDRQGNSITLHEEACTVLPWLEKWKTATFIYQGKVHAACWRFQAGTVVVLDSAGDVTPVPPQAFERATGV